MTKYIFKEKTKDTLITHMEVNINSHKSCDGFQPPNETSYQKIHAGRNQASEYHFQADNFFYSLEV